MQAGWFNYVDFSVEFYHLSSHKKILLRSGSGNRKKK